MENDAIKNIKEKVEEMETIMKALREYGAYDTEPEVHFHRALVYAARDKKVYVPNGAGGWELYTDMKGVEDVAKFLTTKMKEVAGFIVYMYRKSLSDDKDVDEYIKKYAWRIEW